MVVKTFVEPMKIVIQKIENSKTIESLTTAYLENFLVFQLDDKPIPSVNTFSSSITSSITLIAL